MLNSNSLLYHYSQSPLPILLTKRQAGADPLEITRSEKKQKELNLEAPYVDHMSFFFDPIPSKLVSEIFGSNHNFWYKGNVIYEHLVDVNQFEGDVLYRVVESVRKTAFMDEFIEVNDWTDDDPELLLKFLSTLSELQSSWGN